MARPRFVVQRHDATRLHFDLRLQLGDALLSWAVPRGPSLDPRDKRLAVRTEDHTLAHLDFEGRTPGGSTVIVWDTGEFDNLTERGGRVIPLVDAVAAGHIKFALHGHKLTGGFALTNTAMGGDTRNWLLVKVADEHADPSDQATVTSNESVLSGLTNDDLAAQG